MEEDLVVGTVPLVPLVPLEPLEPLELLRDLFVLEFVFLRRSSLKKGIVGWWMSCFVQRGCVCLIASE